MLPHLEAMLGPPWGYLGPSWGYVGPSWGLCWPILRASWAHLGARLAHLGGYAGPSWGYVGPSWGLSWPMLTHLKAQDPKNGNSKKHLKTRVFLVIGGRGGGPSLLTTAMPRPAPGPQGPWPDWSAYARQPARGPCGGDRGRAGSKSSRLCCPIGRLCRSSLGLSKHARCCCCCSGNS